MAVLSACSSFVRDRGWGCSFGTTAGTAPFPLPLPFPFVIGVAGAVLVTSLTLSSSEYVQSIPVGTLAILLVVSALAGLLAAQVPARRAARLDMLQALASE